MSEHDTQVAEEYRDSNRLDARIALHKHHSTNPINWHHWVFNHILRLNPRRILEVGCGSGSLWIENRERVPSHWELTLIDQSEGMLATARANLGSIQARFEHADVRFLPFESASFDLVIANHMLYHVVERDVALTEIARVLTPEGQLLASTNSAFSMREYDGLLEEFHNTKSIHHIADVRTATGFNLEGGAGQLLPHFSCVTVLRYDDSIQVTAPEPIVAYALASSQITHEQAANFQTLVQARIDGAGFFETYKRNGLFVASNIHPA